MLAPDDKTTKSWALALTSMAAFVVILDTTVVATALSTIRRDLGASIEALEWTVNAFNLSFAALLVTAAALGDRLGRRRMLMIGLGVFVAASAGCAVAGSVSWLIAARAVQGAGAALVTPLAMTLLTAAFPPEERSKALGIFSGITGLALIAGPVVGGVIAAGLAWQWIFWVNVPIGLVLIPLIGRRIRESVGPGTAIDGGGVVLVTAAAVLVVWGLMHGNRSGWASTEVLTALAAGLALSVTFVAWELRCPAPLVPMRFFRSRAFSAAIGATFLSTAAMFGQLFFLPQFFEVAQGDGPLGAGLRLVPWTATLFVVAPLAGRMVDRLGERPLIVTGLVLQAAGMGWIAVIAAPGLAYAQLVAPLILAGAGVSMTMPVAQNAVVGAVARSAIGQASGVFYMFRFLGAVSGIAIAVAVFAETGSFVSPRAFSAGFTGAIGVAAGLSLLAAVVGLWQPARPRQLLADPAKA